MKKIKRIEAASYCCEGADTVDIVGLIERTGKISRIEKVEAASYCCEASEAIDVKQLIDEQ